MSQDELSLRPRYRAEGLLEVVPGLFSVQHAGGGKAQQDFARGFNLDHGTDMAFFVDDVPINAVSHAHGQGFSDLHFIIPETVARVDSTKGTYAADVGDFGTAGSTSFRMADHTPESIARLELAPSTGHERLVVVESPELGDKWRMAVAAEALYENGPFIHPEDYGRFNGYAKATHDFDERSQISFMVMAYGGSWNMSGVLRMRRGRWDAAARGVLRRELHQPLGLDRPHAGRLFAAGDGLGRVPPPARRPVGRQGHRVHAALQPAALSE
jgi:hypothetical protein